MFCIKNQIVYIQIILVASIFFIKNICFFIKCTPQDPATTLLGTPAGRPAGWQYLDPAAWSKPECIWESNLQQHPSSRPADRPAGWLYLCTCFKVCEKIVFNSVFFGFCDYGKVIGSTGSPRRWLLSTLLAKKMPRSMVRRLARHRHLGAKS